MIFLVDEILLIVVVSVFDGYIVFFCEIFVEIWVKLGNLINI